MKWIQTMRLKLEGLLDTMNRFPLTVVFLVATAIVNVISIQTETEAYAHFLFTGIIGALLSAVTQLMYERFFHKRQHRLLLMAVAIVLTILYYFIIRTGTVFNIENGTKTAVMVFALALVFIWGPTIKSKFTFNQSFMATFKAFVITVAFTAVIAGGISLIVFAVDSLLVELSYKTTPHLLNVVITLFTPIFFLSYIPYYPGKGNVQIGASEPDDNLDALHRAVSCPRTLEVLISYIVIPLTAIYTMILLIYVFINIRGEFWTENLLEPLLVSYAITVILVYILASELDNKFAQFFRKVFPKLLLPIVLFQTIASILKIGELGVTHGRYYVIMFGVFAFIAGIIFSFFPPRKNGWIAAVLIVFSVISIVPPVDAFTVSRVNQTSILEKILLKNDMLVNGAIVPKDSIPIEDKRTITETVSYLDRMEYTKEIDWLPDRVFYYDNFEKLFGFTEVYYDREPSGSSNRFAYFEWERASVVPISNYDVMLQVNSYTGESESMDPIEIPFEVRGETFTLEKVIHQKDMEVRLRNAENDELVTVSLRKVFEKVLDANEQKLNETGKGNFLTVEEAIVIEENEAVKLQFLVQSAEHYDNEYSGIVYLFIELKNK